MNGQIELLSRYELWELGIAERCVRGRGMCRYQPCTVVQGVRCCAACATKCHAPCERARKR